MNKANIYKSILKLYFIAPYANVNILFAAYKFHLGIKWFIQNTIIKTELPNRNCFC